MKVLVKNNDLYGTQDVLDYVNKMQQEATSIEKYLFDASAFLKTLGIEINYDSIPDQLGMHKKGDKTFIGWKGTMNGTTKNLNDEKNRLYGPVFKTWTSWSDTAFIENDETYYPLYLATAESCTGGGGDSFKYYQSYIIHMESFPLIEKQYNNLISDKIKEDLQIKFNKEIDQLEDKFDSDYKMVYDQLLRKSDIQTYKSHIRDAEEFINNMKRKIEDTENIAKNVAKHETAFELPEPPNAMLNLFKYTELRKKMGNSERTLDQETIVRLTTRIEDYYEKNLHHFI